MKIYTLITFMIITLAHGVDQLQEQALSNGYAMSEMKTNEDGTFSASGIVYIPGAGFVPVEFNSYVNIEEEIDHLQREVERHAQRYYRRTINEVSQEVENGAEDVFFNGLRAYLVKEIESLNTVWQREMRRHDIFEIEDIETMDPYVQEQQCKERVPFIFRDSYRNMRPATIKRLDKYCEAVTQSEELRRSRRVFEAVHCLQFYESATNSSIQLSVGQIINRCVSVFDIQMFENPTRIIWWQQ